MTEGNGFSANLQIIRKCTCGWCLFQVDRSSTHNELLLIKALRYMFAAYGYLKGKYQIIILNLFLRNSVTNAKSATSAQQQTKSQLQWVSRMLHADTYVDIRSKWSQSHATLYWKCCYMRLYHTLPLWKQTDSYIARDTTNTSSKLRHCKSLFPCLH